jgi:putative SOS response-associated peptidase YedK
MCGRYALGKLEWWILQEMFKLQQAALNMQPRWNIAPTQDAPIIRHVEDHREAVMARWGLVPHFWSKPLSEMKYSTFNAKSETAASTPSFRDPFRKRRCIVPAIGFYEWTGEKGAKQPWWITAKGQEWFGFAGLWDRAEIEGQRVESFTILTTRPNQEMSQLHSRMPVILRPDHYDLWLDPANDRDAIEPLLAGLPDGSLEYSEANTSVGNVRQEGEWLTVPGEGTQARLV